MSFVAFIYRRRGFYMVEDPLRAPLSGLQWNEKYLCNNTVPQTILYREILFTILYDSY